AEAAQAMSDQPAALQLRLLQTVVAVAAEKNSTLVLPFPVELLRFLERSGLQAQARTEAYEKREAAAAPAAARPEEVRDARPEAAPHAEAAAGLEELPEAEQLP
ncbi:slipin family protein, partial [Streptomyces rimosus]